MQKTVEQNMAGTLQQQRAMWDQQEATRIQQHGEHSVDDPAYLKYKLWFYTSMEVKFDPPMTDLDRMHLDLLRIDRRKLEKKLYPNWVQRQLQRLITRLIDKPKIKEQYERRLQGQTNQLRQALRRTGLSTTVEQLQLDFSTSVGEMSVPVSFRTGPEERMDLQLHFRRDSQGDMQFPYYEATLKDLNDPKNDRKYSFRVDKQQGFDVKEAYNLLKGRAVKRSYINAEGKSTAEWVQLNFDEKRADGNYVMERFPSGYGFDLDAAIPAWLQFNEHISHEKIQSITSGLQKGNQESFQLPVGGKMHTYYVEANPRQRTVDFFDHKGRAVLGDIQQQIQRKQNVQQRSVRAYRPLERISVDQLHRKGQKL